MLEISNVVKGFGDKKVLNGINLEVKEGSIFGLVGVNGAGKSTLMKILSGVYTRDSGEIEIFGQKIEGDLTTNKAQELGIAIIHQELNMCQHLTIAANMFLGHEILKMIIRKKYKNYLINIMN